MTDLRIVPSRSIDAAWPSVAALIADACMTSNGRYQADDVRQALSEARAQLWLVCKDEKPQAAIVTEIAEYPRLKACRVRIVVGANRREWQDCITEIEKWAKSIGCTRIESNARPGWTRISKQYGYQHTHSFLEKVI